MNKLNLKIASILIVIVYSIVVLYWVISDEGPYGIRFLSIWSVVFMWLLISLFIDTGKKIKNKTIEEIEKYKKVENIMLVCFDFNAYGDGIA
ncbi:hypothetical protein [Acinetobacter haemolyticus]|uniref:hypothetical protein n=1 Tax=Acinetobacter haemolyticus TaxID=29430 RepID=UPI0021CD8011|nr:hypothetical protein [Acinetobacter haemolyticus]MCU4378201.1 hypothetical protein [Acinetobacter haemolyticus]